MAENEKLEMDERLYCRRLFPRFTLDDEEMKECVDAESAFCAMCSGFSTMYSHNTAFKRYTCTLDDQECLENILAQGEYAETIVDDVHHLCESGCMVRFSEVQGMIDMSPEQATETGPYSLRIGYTLLFHSYMIDGIATFVKTPLELNFSKLFADKIIPAIATITLVVELVCLELYKWIECIRKIDLFRNVRKEKEEHSLDIDSVLYGPSVLHCKGFTQNLEQHLSMLISKAIDSVTREPFRANTKPVMLKLRCACQ